jgi:hypothetical protein
MVITRTRYHETHTQAAKSFNIWQNKPYISAIYAILYTHTNKHGVILRNESKFRAKIVCILALNIKLQLRMQTKYPLVKTRRLVF